MRVSAKDSNYFNKTKDYIVPKALELLSKRYGLENGWENDRYLILDYDMISADIHKFMVLDTKGNYSTSSKNNICKLDFIMVNTESNESYSPKSINFLN